AANYGLSYCEATGLKSATSEAGFKIMAKLWLKAKAESHTSLIQAMILKAWLDSDS
ncbi:8488_t:CDS:2, partial [Cetraspora pellucida]